MQKINAKRWLSGILAAILLLAVFPLGTFAEEGDLTITTKEELLQFAQSVSGGESYTGKTVVLAANLSLAGEDFAGIGSSAAPFKGTFDGQNHIVSDLSSSVGFFADVNGGTVKNLIVRGMVNGASNIAGVVGKLTAGAVQNCGNEASVSGGANVGGVVGSVNGDCTVSGCYNSGAVSGTTGYIGGVTGQHWRAGTVENCYNIGTVSGPATVGGITGGHKASSPVLRNCYSAGTVVDTAGNQNNIGAVIGATRGTNENCYFLSGCGTNDKTGITEVSSLSAAQLGDAFKADEDGINGGLPVFAWQINQPDLIITTYEALKSFAEAVSGGESYEGKLVRLGANITLGGESSPWTPIGTASAPFKGTFDGGYHVIDGMEIASGSAVGFFGAVNGGTVKNLIVAGKVNGASDVGGVVGKLTAATMQNCGNEATVSGGANVGGVVGSVNGDCTVSGCYNKGAVSGTTGYIGGVTGQHWRGGTVEDCYNLGMVTGPATVGGITGGHKAASPVLNRCYNGGTVVGKNGSTNNIDAVIGASRGTNTDCFYLAASGTSSKSGVTAVESISASSLGTAFVDADGGVRLAWESKRSTETPVRPAFVEKTALSAALASYIKESVASTKRHGNVTGSLLGNPDYLSGASSTSTDWMALAMGRFSYLSGGETVPMIDDGTGYADYLAAMKSYIERTYAQNNGILHSAKATEWHRAVVAITALGGDPTNFGTYNSAPINLIADGSYNNALRAGPGTQGINGWIWGLIAMDTGMYDVPQDAKYPRETFIKEILKMQLCDGVNGNEYGGWVLGGYGTSSDVDITAMALQALAPYYNDDTVYTYTNEISNKEVSKTVRRCVDEALERLGSMQNANGGFSSWNTDNVESISQVVVALCSLGINPTSDSRFISTEGKSLLDGMLRFKLTDGGFCHVLGGGWNSMATDQATYALVSYWRLENGMRALYDMRGERSAADTAAIAAAQAAIAAASDPTAADYKAQLKTALAAFRAVSKAERRYVDNYSLLAAGLDLVGSEEALDNDAPYAVSIAVDTLPKKVRYYAGERFDAAGMKVVVVYSDGSRKPLTEYKVSPAGEFALGTDTVYISYGILRTSISVEVRERMPWQGEGTEEDPYLITSADDLIDLRYYISEKNMKTSGVCFRLTRDINMKNAGDWRGIADNTNGFCGHFDGAGFSVWNLNAATYNACGLFGRLGNGALIENLTIASGSLGGNYHYSIGAIAGEVYSDASVTIRNCRNYASLRGVWGIGGILGGIEDGASAVIENCSNHGKVTAQYTGGGIVGQVGPNRWRANGADVTLNNCYNVGTIGGKAEWGVGGLLGALRMCGDTAQSTMRNCYNAGEIKPGAVSGTLLGSITETTLVIGNVYSLAQNGLAAWGSFDDDGSETVGTVKGDAVQKTEAQMKDFAFTRQLGTAFASDTANQNSGYPILSGEKPLGEEAPIHGSLEIATAQELAEFAKRVNDGESFTGKTVLLTANIDLSAYDNWTPIGRYERRMFDGFFDGQGFVIDNLYSTVGGLFGYVGTNATIQNVGIGSGKIGADNLSFMGGIAKWSNGADFINCFNAAQIICSGWSGGIVGTIRDGGESTVRGCYNIGKVTARDSVAGGIIGHLSTGGHGTDVRVTVENCYNLGAVTAADCAGGIVGRAQAGHVIGNCYNAGKISVVGENILDGAGGITGLLTSNNEVSNCYYDTACSARGVASGTDTATGLDSAALQSQEFLQTLGNAFKEDHYGLVNGGYALLYWQKTLLADEVDDAAAKIEAIGEVTLEKEELILSAQQAWDALNDAQKAALKNYAVLAAAQARLAELKAATPENPEIPENPEQPGKNDPQQPGEKPADNKNTENPPKTGDEMRPVMYLFCAVISLCAGIVVLKPKKRV